MTTLKELQKRLQILKYILIGIVTLFITVGSFFMRASKRMKIVIIVVLSALVVLFSFTLKEYFWTERQIQEMQSIRLIIDIPDPSLLDKE